MPTPPLDKSERSDDVNVIRKTLLGLLEFRQCPGEIALSVIAVITKSKMSFRQVWIERERAIKGIFGCRQPRRGGIQCHPVNATLLTGEICPSQHKIRIQLHCLLIRSNRT